MKEETCIIKSGSHGITLILNPSAPIEDVLREICYKFAAQKKFFGKANLVLTITGRQLSQEEFEAVVQSIEYNSDVKIDLIYEKNQIRDKRMRNKRDQFFSDQIRKNAKIVLGPIRDGESVHSDSSLLVLGDVEEGSELYAAGNIIVTGALSGFATAGLPDHDDCFVFAGEMAAESLVIGTHEGELPKRKRSFFHRPQKDGEVLLYRQDHFIITNIYDEILNSLFAKTYSE